MIGVNFTKSTAERILRGILGGKPLTPSPAAPGWTIDEMLMVAGACLFAISSHGTWRELLAREAGKPLPSDLDDETREAMDATHFEDLHGALDFVANLTQLVHHREYDRSWEADVSVLLRGEDRSIHPVRGLREPKP